MHAAVARSTFVSQNVKELTGSEHFLKPGCGKIARSKFASENVKKLTGSEHFLKLGCGKMARRCSEKHIFKSKCTKHLCFGALLEVPMSKRSPTDR